MSAMEISVSGNPALELVLPAGPTMELVNPGYALELLESGMQGATGLPGGSNLNLVNAEIPDGVIDGTNRDFTLAHAPVWLVLTKRGLVMSEGEDFTLTGNAISMAPGAEPFPDDPFIAKYIWVTP
ncbi:MAG: hypothetical protein ACK4SJ_11210 [Sphingorhabdus sp.]